MYRGYRPRRSRILYHRLAILILVPVLLAGGIFFLLTRLFWRNHSGDLAEYSSYASSISSAAKSSVAPSVSSAAVSSKDPSSASLSGLDPKTELSKWYLRLASAKHPLPEDFSPQVSDINPQYCRDPNFRFDSRAVDSLNAMCAAAAKDGIKLLVISPYRSVQKQSQLFAQEVAKYSGLSKEEAEAKAAQSVLPPGTSEHNLGLAVDFDSLSASYENSANFRWLSRHAADYGFILRYPKNKTQITGVTYEPWHYRYVGVEHARQIKQEGLCLEEYIDKLKTLSK